MNTKKSSGTQKRLTSTRIEKLFAHRKEMLRSLRGDVPVATHDVLDAKLAREKTHLYDILESDEHAHERRKREGLLRREFFIRIPLEPSFL